MTDMYLSAPDEVKQGLAKCNPLTPLVLFVAMTARRTRSWVKNLVEEQRMPRKLPV
jgi:hypothetical protein